MHETKWPNTRGLTCIAVQHRLLFVGAPGRLLDIRRYHDYPMYYWLCLIVPKHPFSWPRTRNYRVDGKKHQNSWANLHHVSWHRGVQIEDSANSGRGFFKNLDEFRRRGEVLGGWVGGSKGRSTLREGFGYVCVHGRRRRMLIRDYVCVYFCVPCKVCGVFLACTLHHMADVLRGSSACISLREMSSWSPLWESLAVKLILLSHTPVSVPHLSAQPQGPSCPPHPPTCTPGFSSFFSPASRLLWMAAPIETELDK